MKMYLIVPKEHRITEIEYNGTYEEMCPHLTYKYLDSCRINKEGDRLFLNDTGLIDGTEYREGAFWWLTVHDTAEHWQKFVGQALYWGSKAPDNADPYLTLEQVGNRISWVKPVSYIER